MQSVHATTASSAHVSAHLCVFMTATLQIVRQPAHGFKFMVSIIGSSPAATLVPLSSESPSRRFPPFRSARFVFQVYEVHIHLI
jgi:hypothetical protein